ncbi:MAG: hypothetical protein LBF63_12150 [Treponema sp.]|nr:hypothetical protein [Treponema sp.]
MKKRLIPLALGLLMYTSCPQVSDDSVDQARVLRAAIPADFMGMVHAGSKSEADQEYALLDKLGVRWMLTDFSWSSIQPEKKTWNLDAFKSYADKGKAQGKKILAILDYDVGWIHDGTYSDDPFTDGKGHKYVSPSEIPLFCDYVKKTVAHYKDRVDAWCIWNEPNLQPRFWPHEGTKEDFFALTGAAAAAIREVDPDAFIIGGAFNTLASDDWVRGIFESGAMSRIDAIAYHPYMPSPGPTSTIFRNFKKTVSDYGFGDRIWITEVGYPTYTSASMPAGRYGTDVPLDRMPETVLQTLTLLAVEGADRIFWYHLFDPPAEKQESGDSEDWFGLVQDDFTLKPGAAAYRLFAHNIPGSTCKTPRRVGLPDSVKTYHFEGSGGKHALVVWNEVTIRERTVRVYLPGSNQKVYNIETGTPASIGENSTYTLKARDGTHHYIQFFTWENPNTLQAPGVSAL